MWRLSKPTSHGGNSVRSVFTLATATFIALIVAFLTTFLVTTTPVHADADASWNKGAIEYGTVNYQGPVSDTVITQLNLPKGTIAYTYVDPDSTTDSAQSGNSNSSNSPPKQVHVIYFASGTDLKSANQGSYKTYTVVNATTFSDPSAVKSISIDPTNYSQGQANTSSCAVPGGLGWIICPLSNNLATAMDYIYNLIKGFFVVQPPAVGNSHDDMYIAWNISRSIANIAFIIVFIIIIYSQITQLGLSNYGLKKLLPRLIIAAVLMNLSYYICTLAIDISNVLGYSVHDLFTSIRQTIFNINPGDAGSGDVWSFESMTGFILSGGTAGLAAGVGIGSALLTTGGSVVGLVFLLLPVLLGLILAVLVVFVILAARQALIVILLIISPLAFVAYLLPNTEKLFGRWRELFMTMLVFFPAFSLIFGGAQLASAVIIQNASSINIILLGLIVQVAPLVITPILLRLSGNVLGRIAGIVNDPRKGLVDRTRNWANARAENAKYQNYKRLDAWQNSGNRFKRGLAAADLAGRGGRGLDYRKHRLEQSTARGKAQYEAFLSGKDATTRTGLKIKEETHAAEHEKQVWDKRVDQALEEAAAGRSAGLESLAALGRERGPRNFRDQTERLGELRSAIQGEIEENTADSLRGRQKRLGKSYVKFASHAAHDAQMVDQEIRILENAITMAKSVQSVEYANVLLDSDNNTYSVRAGGIDKHGADSAVAAAINTIRTDYGKNITEARQINKHFNLSSSERQKHALGTEEVVGKMKVTINGVETEVTRTFKNDSIYTREAAIEDQMTFGTAFEAQALVMASGSDEFVKLGFQNTVAETLAKNSGMQAKMLHLAGQSIDDITQGKIKGLDDVDWVTARALARGKLSQRDVASLDPEGVKEFLEVMKNPDRRSKAKSRLSDDDQKVFDQRLADFQRVVADTFTGDERGNIKSGARDGLLEIAKMADPSFVDPSAGSSSPTSEE